MLGSVGRRRRRVSVVGRIGCRGKEVCSRFSSMLISIRLTPNADCNPCLIDNNHKFYICNNRQH